MTEKTMITVIIATHNRADLLQRTLRSLSKCVVNASFECEVIVADNNSTDHTKAVVEELKPNFGVPLLYLFEPRQGKSYAVNHAIGLASGSILAFTDDDVVIEPTWLAALYACFQKFSCDVVSGRTLPDYPQETPQWVKDNADILMGTIVFYDYGEQSKRYEKPMVEPLGANLAVRKSVFDECGLLRTDLGVGSGYLGEDTELINRIERSGKSLYYCGAALVWHPVELKRTTMKYIGQWNIALGRYRVLMEKDRINLDVLPTYKGVPRYLVRIMTKTWIQMLLSFASKREFLKCWISLSQDRGRAMEYRRLFKAKEGK